MLDSEFTEPVLRVKEFLTLHTITAALIGLFILIPEREKGLKQNQGRDCTQSWSLTGF